MIAVELLTALITEGGELEVIIVGRQRYVLKLKEPRGHFLFLFDVTLVFDTCFNLLDYLGREQRNCSQ